MDSLILLFWILGVVCTALVLGAKIAKTPPRRNRRVQGVDKTARKTRDSYYRGELVNHPDFLIDKDINRAYWDAKDESEGRKDS